MRIVASFLCIGTPDQDACIAARDIEVCATLASLLHSLRDDWCPRVRTSLQHVLSTLVNVRGSTALGLDGGEDPVYEDSSMSIFVVHGDSGRKRASVGSALPTTTLLPPLEPPQELMSTTVGMTQMYSIEDFVSGPFDVDDDLEDSDVQAEEFAFLGESGGGHHSDEEFGEQGLEDIDYEDLGIFEIDEDDFDDALLEVTGGGVPEGPPTGDAEFSGPRHVAEVARPTGPRPMSADRRGVRRSVGFKGQD